MPRPLHKLDKGVPEFARHFTPIHRARHDFPDEWRGLAVRLSWHLGTVKTAYLFDVRPSTISSWRRRSRA